MKNIEMPSNVPTMIFIGKNCIEENSDKIKALGSKCLIITGKTSAKRCGALDCVTNVLDKAGIKYEIYDKICQNPTVSSCLEAGKIGADFGAEFVIGIGGGSPMDASKAIAVACANPNINENGLYSLNSNTKALPIVTVGTTAGTGSEVTAVSVLTNSKGLKKSIHGDYLFPVLSFGDATFTMSLNSLFTNSTAVDALSHSIESYFCRNATDVSKRMAVTGIKTMLPTLCAMAEGKTHLDFDMREALYVGSIYGGLAISVTGTCFPHAVGYFLSESHAVPHGTACAVFLPRFLSYNRQTVPMIYDKFCEEIEISGDALIQLLRVLTPEIDVTVSSEERLSLLPRWNGNKSILKAHGTVTPQFIDGMIKELFGSD